MDAKFFQLALKENIAKNVLILLFAFLFYNTIYSSLSTLNSAVVNDFLLILSLLLLIACFGAFSFSYQFSDMKNTLVRFLSHFSTFVFMLLVLFLLEALVVSVGIVYQSLYAMVLVFSALLYFGIVLYDFWDLLRSFKE